MNSIRVTAKGGQLHNKKYDVPANVESFPVEGGEYRVKGKTASWHPLDTASAPEGDDSDADSE